MSLLEGILNVTNNVGANDAVGKYQLGAQNASNMQKTKAETAILQTQQDKSQFELDLQKKLQQALTDSMNEDGTPDFTKMAENAKRLGVAPQVLEHVLKIAPEIWESQKKVLSNKAQIEAYAPGSTGWTNNKRGSIAAPKPNELPVTNAPTKGLNEDATATPTTTPVEVPQVQPSTSTPIAPEAPTESLGSHIFGLEPAPIAPVESQVPDVGFKVEDLDPAVQNQLLGYLRTFKGYSQWTAKNPDGTPMTRGQYVQGANPFIKGLIAQKMTGITKPDPTQYGDDIPGYRKALAEYDAKVNQSAIEVREDLAKAVPTMQGLDIARSQNLIAQNADKRSDVQVGNEIQDKTSTANALEIKANSNNDMLKAIGYPTISPLLYQKAPEDERKILDKKIIAMSQLMELAAKLKKEKRNMTKDESVNSNNNLLILENMTASQASEEEIKQLTERGWINRLGGALLKKGASKEAVKDAMGQHIIDKINNGTSFETILGHTSFNKTIKQYSGDAPVVKPKGWKDDKAKPDKPIKPKPINTKGKVREATDADFE